MSSNDVGTEPVTTSDLFSASESAAAAMRASTSLFQSWRGDQTDPIRQLALHCIHEMFGPTVQLVADALVSHDSGAYESSTYRNRRDLNGIRLGSTEETSRSKTNFAQLRSFLKAKIDHVTTMKTTFHRSQSNSEIPTHIDDTTIRAGLLVLMQHGIVSAHAPSTIRAGQSAWGLYTYSFHTSRALLLMRHGRWLEYIHRGTGGSGAESAASVGLVATLLRRGRLRTMDWLSLTFDDHAGEIPPSDSHSTKRIIVEAAVKLVRQGWIKRVPKMVTPEDLARQAAATADPDAGETEFNFSDSKPTSNTESRKRSNSTTENGHAKRIKLESSADYNSVQRMNGAVPCNGNDDMDDDPELLQLLRGNSSGPSYLATLPLKMGGEDLCWTVNHDLFQSSIRAFCLGRLVAELFGSKVQAAGSLVTAALKFRAHREHTAAPGRHFDETLLNRVFAVDDLKPYVPKPVVQNFHSKPGGLDGSLRSSWSTLARLSYPTTVATAHGVAPECPSKGERYEIDIPALIGFLRERLYHRVVQDRCGPRAARIISILRRHGWLEADSIADHAMLPAKETRELLHLLFRNRYVECMSVAGSSSGGSASRQSGYVNPVYAVYLWAAPIERLARVVTENVVVALRNVQMRRQHELLVGKEWLERERLLHETDGIDENESARDEVNKEKFRLGLERLDCATAQLDETLMALRDF
jgi:DNA-directed RNA polymerase III subunit RPC3